MDEISYELREEGIRPSAREFEEHLAPRRRRLRVDGGHVGLAPRRRRWNELQNTPRDIKALSDHLVRLYRGRVRDMGVAGGLTRRRCEAISRPARSRAHRHI